MSDRRIPLAGGLLTPILEDDPVSEVAAGPSAAETVLVSAVRNEAPFLLEWIAYHKVIGFDRIVILSNTSDDGTEDILSALAAAGEVVHHHVDPSPHQSPQNAAGQAFEKREGYRDGSWYIWLDADEFLNIHVGARKVPDLIAALGGAHGIFLNWRLFGPSGHTRFPGRFVSPDFARAARPRLVAHLETKSLFRTGPFVAGFSEEVIGRPRLVPGTKPLARDFLGGKGQPLQESAPVTQDWLAGKPVRGRTNLATWAELGWAYAQINHYSVRTPEFFRLKALRGRGAASWSVQANSRHTERYFRRFDRNEAEDRSILHWEAATTAEMDRLRALPGVAGALAHSARLVADVLAKAVGPAPDDIVNAALPCPSELMQGSSVAAADALAKEGTAKIMVEPGPTPGISDETGPEGTPAKPKFKLTFPARERDHVAAAYDKAQNILEYGSGGSTMLAALLGKAVVSVESDRAWADRLTEALHPVSAKAQVHHVDIGPTTDWGRPSDASGAARYHRYALSVWDRPDLGEPDLVLIDGRFRAACLAAVMLRAKRPTVVLFDDYVERKYYHGVEKLARKEEVVGRMARFTVTPGPIPAEMLTQVIGWFSDPR